MKDDFHIPSSAIERLRRFRRADTPPPFRLTQRDGEVLRLVARCRYLRTEHIFRRLFPQGALSNCRRRLRLLYHMVSWPASPAQSWARSPTPLTAVACVSSAQKAISM